MATIIRPDPEFTDRFPAIAAEFIQWGELFATLYPEGRIGLRFQEGVTIAGMRFPDSFSLAFYSESGPHWPSNSLAWDESLTMDKLGESFPAPAAIEDWLSRLPGTAKTWNGHPLGEVKSERFNAADTVMMKRGDRDGR